jgi:hypothetical protein
MFLKKNCAKHVNMGVSEQRDTRVLEMFFFGCGPIKMAYVTKPKKKKLWDAPQLIYMNHNRCPSVWEKLVSKLLTNKIKNQNLTQTIRWGNMYPICIKECAPKTFPHSLSLYLLLKSVSLYYVHLD